MLPDRRHEKLFERKITLGNVLAIVVFLGSIGGLYAQKERELERMAGHVSNDAIHEPVDGYKRQEALIDERIRLQLTGLRTEVDALKGDLAEMKRSNAAGFASIVREMRLQREEDQRLRFRDWSERKEN